MEAYTKKITCPEHLTHEATLYVHGSEYAGIWECDVDGTSDACEHESTHVEMVETDPVSPTDIVYTAPVTVCDVCDCSVDVEPAEVFDCE